MLRSLERPLWSHQKAGLVFALALFTVGAACAQFPRIPHIPGLPRLPGGGGLPGLGNIPGVDRLLKQDPPITTGLADAQTEIPFLDTYSPAQLLPMSQQPRSPEGGFLLTPGAYSFNAQSYCLHPGTHAPGRGRGYLDAPLKGPWADIFRHILQRSVQHPEIPQKDIQELIWALEARAKISTLPPAQLKAATQLLTPQEMVEADGGAMGALPDDVKNRLFARLPEPLRAVYEAENRLRDALSRPNATYDQLEQIAVLPGDAPPDQGGRQVPSGRWSYNRAGYFVRFFPTGYSRTRIEVDVPEMFTVTRDNRARISQVSDSRGGSLAVSYDEAGPVTIQGDRQTSAYRIRMLRFTRGTFAASAVPPTANPCWVLVGSPDGAGRTDAAPADLAGLPDRYTAATALAQQTDQLLKRIGARGSAPSGVPALQELVDLASLREAVLTMPAAGLTDPNLAPTAAEFLANAWQSSLALAASSQALQAELSGPRGWGQKAAARGSSTARLASYTPEKTDLAAAHSFQPGQPLDFDPSSNVAQPVDTGQQRLGESGRDNGDHPPQPCEPFLLTLSGLNESQNNNPGAFVVRNFDGNNPPRQQITIEKGNTETCPPEELPHWITLTRSGSQVRVFTAAHGGAELLFDGTDNRFAYSDLPKTFWVEGAAASTAMRDVVLTAASDVLGLVKTAHFTVLWVDDIQVKFNGGDSCAADDTSSTLYKSITANHGDQLGGPQLFDGSLVQNVVNFNKALGWGTEARGTVHPKLFDYPNSQLHLDRDVHTQVWVTLGAIRNLVSDEDFSTAFPPGNDEFFPGADQDDDPAPNGYIYATDAPGLELDYAAANLIKRRRCDFKTCGAVKSQNTWVRCSAIKEYFVRFSIKQVDPAGGKTYIVVSPPDVPGDNQAGYGPSPVSWNLQ